MHNKVLITGVCGFIGSHLLDLLIEQQNFSIIGIDNLTSGKLKNIEKHLNSRKFEFYNTDIRDEVSLSKILKECDLVIHLAGLADVVPSINNPSEYFDVNVNGTLKLLETCRKLEIKRFIYAASSSCYGDDPILPTSENNQIETKYPYALTKFMGEELTKHWAEVYGIRSISLRFFNVYGPRSRTSGVYGAVFGVFLAQKLANKPLTIVGDGNQERDFTYVRDAVRAISLAAEKIDMMKSKFSVFNVGSNNPQSINSLASLISSKNVHIPDRPGEPRITCADNLKIKENLNWFPTVNFDEGVKLTLLNIEDWRDAPVWDAETIGEATADWFKFMGSNDH